MALVDMKHIDVLVMKRDQARLLQKVQRAGCVQFTPISLEEAQNISQFSFEDPRNDETLNRIKWAIGRLLNYDPVKQSMFRPLPQAGQAELEDGDIESAVKIVEQVELLERQNGELRGTQTRLTQAADQLKPWLELDVPADQLIATATTRLWTGNAPSRGLVKLSEDWKGRPAVVNTLGVERDTAFFIAIVHQSAAEEFLSDLRMIGFQHAAPNSGQETPQALLDRIQHDLASLQDENNSIQQRLSELGVHLPALRLAFESLNAKKARMEAMDTLVHTETVSLMSGWVPMPVAQPLADAIMNEFNGAQAIIRDSDEGEEPPVLLQNNAVIRPYEAVVSGFALPANGALDPTAVMMPFFACFFGMMVSDAGYGLMMAILIPVMVKIMQPSEGAKKIFWILCGGGIATFFWGVLFNTWFGFAPFPSVFDPVNNSLPVMALCIGVGALHLFTGLATGAVQNIRRGDPLSAVYDQLSWALLVIGLGLMLLPQTSEIGKWMAIAGAGIILLTAGRKKSRNPFKRLISGLGALYGVTGWISDLLSYMRLFGMGLATGVIGMVINQLVGMIMGGGIIGIVLGAVIFVAAHLFNAAINILGAYVHACRLQYIEFFGKFYEEGGKPFKPLRFAPRYVRLHE